MTAATPLEGNLVHIATMLVVADIDRSIAFYRDGLGLAVESREEDIALLVRAPLRLYLVSGGPPTPDKPGVSLVAPASPAHVSTLLIFRVGDCAAAYADLAARGVPFLTTPRAPDWGGRRCFARDPDGYLIEIEEPPVGHAGAPA